MAISTTAGVEAEIAALDVQIAAARGGQVTSLPSGLGLAQPPLIVLEAQRDRLLRRLQRLTRIAAIDGET